MAKSKKGSTPKPARRKQKPTKEETVETSGQGVQLLLGNMVGQRDREYYVTTYLGLQGKMEKARSAVRDFAKKAKDAGVDMAAMKSVLAMEKWDPLDLSTYLRQQSAFIRDRGLPIQLSLYESKYGSIEQQAAAMGDAAAAAGRAPEVEIWPENSPGHEAYMRAWNDKQSAMVKEMGQEDAD